MESPRSGFPACKRQKHATDRQYGYGHRYISSRRLWPREAHALTYLIREGSLLLYDAFGDSDLVLTVI